MNKRYRRISRILPIMALLSGLIMIILGFLIAGLDKNAISGILILMGSGISITALALRINRRRIMEKFLSDVSEHADDITSNILSAFPIPMVVANIDGTIKWYNEFFEELFQQKNLFSEQISSVLSGIKWGDILKSTELINKSINLNNKRYEVIGRMVRERRDDSKKDIFSVYLYMIDKSEYDALITLYENEKTDVAIICVDNFDEIMQRVDDNTEEEVVSGIRKYLNIWAQMGNAVVKRLDVDRYFAIFDHEKLAKYVEEKFTILENVRKIGEEYNLLVSISIGIGSGGTLAENEKYARSALEMTQGRGGDQVCVKTGESFKFYGGKNKEYEKSTRVKTRSVAGALKEFIRNADQVFLMGHSNADYDCFGAAMGLQRVARELGVRTYIVNDNNSPAVKPMMETLVKVAEYDSLFITNENALERITEKSVLIVLDTHRPQMLPCPQLTQRTNKIVVIDHHRRSMEFINPCALIYHEPYASSTCEMVTELIDYMDMSTKLTRLEVECLYTGILMDTKNFLVKTGVRTFEAASILRRLGLDTLDVKKLFNVEKLDYDHKVDIVKTAVEIYPGVALAQAKETYPNIRVIASQAADEMLNIGENKASIVIYPLDGMYGICARSICEINVQLIMEELGGGGHAGVAGAQIRSKDVDRIRREVTRVTLEYIKEHIKGGVIK